MKVRLLTYNIKFHRAYKDLPSLVSQHKPDFLCLQECNIRNIGNKVRGLQLVASSRVGTMGLATYANARRFNIEKTEDVGLASVWYEHVNRQPRFRLQLMHVKLKRSKQYFKLANLHLANLLASNYGRRRQAKMLFRYVENSRCKNPAIIAGDFNYPVAHRRLTEIAASSGFHELGSSHKAHTHNNPLIRGKFDRVFTSDGIKETHYEVLPFASSDHAPLIVEVEIGYRS